MKKIIVVFIAISMVFASLVGSFTLVASAKATTYTVTFDSQGGSYTPAPIKGIAYGATITLPKAPTKAGRIFECWSFLGKNPIIDRNGNPVFTVLTATTPIIANITVSASYFVLGSSMEHEGAPNSITITEHSSPTNSPTFNFTATGKGLPATFSLKNQTRSFKNLVPGLYTITMKAMPGYATNSFPSDIFLSAWIYNKKNSPWNKVNPDGSMIVNILVAAGESFSLFFNNRIIHTVTFDAQGGSPTPAPITIAYGGTITLPKAPTKAGFTFASWNTKADGTGKPFTSTTKVTADITVYASYKAITYTVTFDSQGGSAVAPITGITAGTTITLPETPSLNGATFIGWNTSRAGTTANFDATTPVTANITVYAIYTVFVPGYWYFWNIPGFMKSTTFHLPTSILQWQNSTISFLGGAK